jgi:hypothetical protein
LVFLAPLSTTPPPPIFTGDCTLASFLNRQVRPPRRPNRSRSHSQPPVRPESPPNQSVIFVPPSEILPLNQARPDEPVYPSISRFYQPRNASLLPQRDTLPHHEVPLQEAHQIPVNSQKLHCYLPEEIYLSSVLPSRTPRELRYLQDHCWRLFQQHRENPPHYIHGLDESYRITTSPLLFENLFWRYSTFFSEVGITEEYYFIKRDRRPSRPDRPRLEPAYSVFYPWVGTYWKTTQLDSSQRNLPQTPGI